MKAASIKAQVVKLSPQPWDVLVFRACDATSFESMTAMAYTVAKRTGCMVVTLPPGCSLTDLSEDDLRTIGLQKA